MLMCTVLQALEAANIPYDVHPPLGDFTMNVATITGGVKTNVVPDACHRIYTLAALALLT